MTTEKFRKIDFEGVLNKSILGTDFGWSCAGIVGGEFRYVSQLDDYVFVQINSTILMDGLAADTAENSIRVWLTDENDQPLGNKVQKWVTRVKGWEDRLNRVIDKVVLMGKSVKWCNTCQSVEHVFVVKKEGKNKGRLFAKCACPNSFVWLDLVDDKESPHVAQPPQEKNGKVPSCPKCGGMMALRTRKYDGKEFWGCRMYPACNGTRDVDNTDDVKKMVQGTMEIVEQTKGIEWSKYQIDIFRTVQNLPDSANVVVRALAGTGKTTTIAQSTKLLPKTKKTIVVVFNRHNVDPVKAKVPDYVGVRTYNSLGWAGCRKEWGAEIILDEDKVNRILENVLDKNVYRYIYGIVRQMVGLVKVNLTGTTPAELMDIAEYYGIEMNGDQAVIFQAVEMVIVRCAADTKTFDYDDQCWMPIIHNIALEKYDYVYVDEAQDTDRCQMALALASVNETGHIIAVGDDNQSMYGFRGADARAIPNLIESLSAQVLPLSITYRNPQCVVELVNQKFPEIPFEGTGKVGVIKNISEECALVEYKPGDMVLCRTNAPLVPPVFELIRNGIKATIRGRDIGKGLRVLIKKMRPIDLPDLIRKLEDYKRGEMEKLLAAEKNSAAQSLMDKVETIIALSDGVNAIYDLEARIDTIFSEKVEGVVFSTIHRAKGLEAERVFILRPELLPHPMAKKEWEKVQERNIEYVALTRCLSQLVYVTGG